LFQHVHLVGKGEKSRTVPVHPKLREALAAWRFVVPIEPRRWACAEDRYRPTCKYRQGASKRPLKDPQTDASV
jgi:hypothetical protein